MKGHYLATLVLVAFAVAACGTSAETATPSLEPTVEGSPSAPEPTVEESSPSPEPRLGESPLSPPATPSADRSNQGMSPIATPSEPTAQVLAAARQRLASELSVSTEAVEVIAVEPAEWSDTSLGCPRPGEAYAQVVTPGYRLRLRVEERQYEVHTDTSGETAVVCEQDREEGPAAAVAYVSESFAVPQEEIEVLSVESVEWPDASLGCPERGKSYAQVITPGYRVILQVEGREVEVHTDRQGRNVVICKSEG